MLLFGEVIASRVLHAGSIAPLIEVDAVGGPISSQTNPPLCDIGI